MNSIENFPYNKSITLKKEFTDKNFSFNNLNPFLIQDVEIKLTSRGIIPTLIIINFIYNNNVVSYKKFLLTHNNTITIPQQNLPNEKITSFNIKIYSPFSKIKCNTDFTIESKEILFLSARFDWLGGRFLGMLNAMYLAQKFNNTWKFTWIRRKNKLSQKIEIDHPQKYFSSEFMNENFADPKKIYTKYTIVQSRGNEIINNKKRLLTIIFSKIMVNYDEIQ